MAFNMRFPFRDAALVEAALRAGIVATILASANTLTFAAHAAVIAITCETHSPSWTEYPMFGANVVHPGGIYDLAIKIDTVQHTVESSGSGDWAGEGSWLDGDTSDTTSDAVKKQFVVFGPRTIWWGSDVVNKSDATLDRDLSDKERLDLDTGLLEGNVYGRGPMQCRRAGLD